MPTISQSAQTQSDKNMQQNFVTLEEQFLYQCQHMPPTKPLKHPRLMRVLEAMKPPTPAILPRDLHQPKSGQLVPRQPRITFEDTIEDSLIQKVEKPTVALNIGASSISARRARLLKEL